MKTNLVKLLPLLLICLSSCVTLYKPNPVQAPMLEKKGDKNVSGSLGMSGNGLFSLQGAFAVENNTGIMISTMYHGRQSGSDSLTENLNMLSAEAGIGYFTPINEKGNTHFHIYGGSGWGVAKAVSTGATGVNPEISANHWSFFLQPGFTFYMGSVQIGIDLKSKFVNLYDIRGQLFEKFDWWNTDFKLAQDTSMNFLTVEPAFTLRFGSSKIRGLFQTGLVLPAINAENYMNTNTSSYLGVTMLKLSAGISYCF
jgi:hypothetical protein